MININEDKLEIRGNIPTLITEYTEITKKLREIITEVDSEEAAQRVLKRAYDLGFMSEEEIDKEIELVRERFENSEMGRVLKICFLEV